MPIDTIRTINRLMTSAQQWRDGDVTPATELVPIGKGGKHELMTQR
jgi:hypothetical protein